MLIDHKINRIVVTGPESTGKTELAQALASKLNSVWIPEYARQYVENLNRPYEYDDVIQIAQHQVEQEAAFASKIGEGIIIFDTWLIITKVWLDLVFGKCPDRSRAHV